MKSAEPLVRNCEPNMAHDGHVYAICCQREAADDVVSSVDVKTVEGYLVANYEIASFNSL